MTQVDSPTRCIGVDGAPRGWVSVTLDARAGTTVGIEFHERFAHIVEQAGSADVIVVDMPIGLPSAGGRPADVAARERLGPRRSTFFPTPLRSVLDFSNWEEANAHSKKACGKGLSKQAWNLVPKIAEVDAVWSPSLGERLFEGHPETSFAQMAGAPVLSKKATAEGRAQRLELLNIHIGAGFGTAMIDHPARWRTDAIDAAALAWTARRVHDGISIRLGGELDPAGRPMALSI